MVSIPLLTERMGVNYFEENLLELYLQVMPPAVLFAHLRFKRTRTKLFFVFCHHNTLARLLPN